MNRFKAALIGYLILSPVVALAADTLPGITVSGRGEIQVSPDEAVLVVAVETIETDLVQAKAENDRVVGKAMTVIREMGIDKDEVQTDFIRIKPVYSDRKNTEISGYRVTNSIELVLSDLDRLEDLMTSLLEAGINQVASLNFRTTAFRSHRDSAMLMALDAAREKAESMARKLGVEIGRPIVIKEESRSAYPNPSNVSAALNSGNEWRSGALATGRLTVSASVTVTFELTES